MKVMIELSAFELKEANKRGILDALASLEAVEEKPESAAQPKLTPRQDTQQAPSQPVPTQIPTTQSMPTAPITAPPQPIPTQAPVDPAAVQAVQQATVPTQTVSYTMEQLAKAATQIVDAKGQQAILDLLNRFQVQALTMLPKEQYGAFATELRALGAKI